RRWVDSPTSRLSNRTTNRPRWARPSHSSSGHAIICVARPMMSTTGGAPASPNVSYASSISLAATRPSVRAATSSMAAVSHAMNPRSLLPYGWLVAGSCPFALAVGEVGLEDVEGIGHVGPAKADTDMTRLVVDRAGKEQDTGLGELLAPPGEVTEPGDAGEADRARRRADPREGSGVPLEEAVQERQVAPHDREVAVEEDLAVAQRQRGQELTRCARADGRVILQREDGVPQASIAGGDPAGPQPRQAVALGDAAERNGPLILIARGRKPVGRIMLEFPVDLVAEHHQSVRAGELDDVLKHRPRHQRAGGIVRLVEVEQAGRRADQVRKRVQIMRPAVFVPAPPLAHFSAGAARDLQGRLIAGRLDDHVIAGP